MLVQQVETHRVETQLLVLVVLEKHLVSQEHQPIMVVAVVVENIGQVLVTLVLAVMVVVVLAVKMRMDLQEPQTLVVVAVEEVCPLVLLEKVETVVLELSSLLTKVHKEERVEL